MSGDASVCEKALQQYASSIGVTFVGSQVKKVKVCFEKGCVDEATRKNIAKWTAFEKDQEKIDKFIAWLEELVSKKQIPSSAAEVKPQAAPAETKTQEPRFSMPSTDFVPRGFAANLQAPSTGSTAQSVFGSKEFNSFGASQASSSSSSSIFGSSAFGGSQGGFGSTAQSVFGSSAGSNPFGAPAAQAPAPTVWKSFDFVPQCDKGRACDDILCPKKHPATRYTGCTISFA